MAHRPQHKKACKKRATELHDEALFEEPPPPEDCPICMLPLPLYTNGISYYSCCGKDICSGCSFAMDESATKDLCPFCRTPPSRGNKEEIKRVKNLMDAGNAGAFNQLGSYHDLGSQGMQRDEAKACELYLKAGELGYAQAYHNLGYSHYEGMGVSIDKKKAKHYFELAVINGSIQARNNLGCMEAEAGNYQRAMKHFMHAAQAGHDDSLKNVKAGFMEGGITKDEYANTLREYQKSHDEMKSEARDNARVSALLNGNGLG